MLDLLTRVGEAAPRSGERVLCCHPFDETKRAFVTSSEVVRLHEVVWDGEPKPAALSTIGEARG